jgi:hypothetical protein
MYIDSSSSSLLIILNEFDAVMYRKNRGLKIIMGHKDIITKLLINVTEPVIVIDILNNM